MSAKARLNRKDEAKRLASLLKEKLSDHDYAALREMLGDYQTDVWLSQALAGMEPQ